VKEIQWKRFQPGIGPPIERAYVGELRVGFVNLSISGARGDAPAYNYECLLPGIKRETSKGQGKSEAEAKGHLEKMIRAWFKMAE
jgi:hypothetical protein